jgi:hypothetical protein
MNSVEIALSKKLHEAEPALDIFGADRKVLQVAFQDFSNYFKFDWKVGEGTIDCDVAEKMEQVYEKEPAEFESFLTVWTGLWLKKWKSRVKLLFGGQTQKSMSKVAETLSSAEPLWIKLDCKQELVEIVLSALIKNAEICGTQIVAEYLLKMELGKKDVQGLSGKEQVLAVLNGALRKGREMALGVGPLMSVKVDNRYYQTVKN